jgi:hypothetical protein
MADEVTVTEIRTAASPPPAIVEQHEVKEEKSFTELYAEEKAKKTEVAAKPAKAEKKSAKGKSGKSAAAPVVAEAVADTAATLAAVVSDDEDGEAAGEEAVDPAAVKQEAKAKRLQQVIDETLREQRKLVMERQRMREEVGREKQQIAAVKEQLLQFVPEVKRLHELKAQAKLNPNAVLEFFGVSLREALEYNINDEKPTPQAEMGVLRQQIADMRREAHEKEQAQQRAREEYQERMRTQQSTQLVENQRQATRDEVIAAGDQFPLLNKTGRHQAVWDLMLHKYTESNGKLLLSPMQAATYVERALRDRMAQDANELLPMLRELGIVKGSDEEKAVIAAVNSSKANGAPLMSNKNTASSTTKVGRQPVLPKEAALEKAIATLKAARK